VDGEQRADTRADSQSVKPTPVEEITDPGIRRVAG